MLWSGGLEDVDLDALLTWGQREQLEARLRRRERAVAAIREKNNSLAVLKGMEARIAFLEEREQAALAAGDAEEAERRRAEAERHGADLPGLRRRHEEALAQAEAVKVEICREEERLREEQSRGWKQTLREATPAERIVGGALWLLLLLGALLMFAGR